MKSRPAENQAIAALKRQTYQMKLKFRNLSQTARIVLLVSFVICVILTYKGIQKAIITDLTYLADKEKCPACYGERMCKRLSEATVHGVNKLHLVTAWNIKNVFTGRIWNTELVFKKLAHDGELDRLDALICHGRLRDTCSTNDVSSCPPVDIPVNCKFHSWVERIMETMDGPLKIDDILKLSDATECPSPRLLQRMIHRYAERGDFVHTDGLSPIEKMQLIYTLAVNQEPIVLQMFPNGEGWPFPAYVGACGRMVGIEYAGVPLRTFFYSPWMKRLLKIADHLTDNASGFRLYFSDISLDNYIVDENGKVLIADAENIVIVDDIYVHSTKPSPDWNHDLVSQFDECPENSNCLAIDVVNLCKHSKSDFNYYAVCRSLLSSYAQDEEGLNGGLLHSLPDSLEEKTRIVNLLNECAKPTEGMTRFDIVYKLTTLLEKVQQREIKKKSSNKW